MFEHTLNSLRLINELEILIPVTVLAALLVAISKSGFGGALGSLGLPVMVLAFPPKFAIAVFAFISCNRLLRCFYVEKISCYKNSKINGFRWYIWSNFRLDLF